MGSGSAGQPDFRLICHTYGSSHTTVAASRVGHPRCPSTKNCTGRPDNRFQLSKKATTKRRIPRFGEIRLGLDPILLFSRLAVAVGEYDFNAHLHSLMPPRPFWGSAVHLSSRTFHVAPRIHVTPPPTAIAQVEKSPGSWGSRSGAWSPSRQACPHCSRKAGAVAGGNVRTTTDAPAAGCPCGWCREAPPRGGAGRRSRVRAQAACRQRRRTPNGPPTPLRRHGVGPCPVTIGRVQG